MLAGGGSSEFFGHFFNDSFPIFSGEGGLDGDVFGGMAGEAIGFGEFDAWTILVGGGFCGEEIFFSGEGENEGEGKEWGEKFEEDRHEEIGVI